MITTNLFCKVCGAKANKPQLLDGAHLSKTLCDLNREVYDLRSQVVITEELRDRLSGDVQALIKYGLEENVVPDRKWLRYARRYFKGKLRTLNCQVAELQKVKDGIIMYHVSNGLAVPTHQDKAKIRNLKLIS